jgi:16S rRNA (uracil1498-N3)-methyltransferase
MHRFFVPTDQIADQSVTLAGETARQIFRVLRLRPGDRIAVLDDTGWEYTVDLLSVSSRQATGLVVEKALNDAESSATVTLYQAMIRPEKFEFVLQKGTELGVVGFIPIICERSSKTPDGNRLSPNRRQRWEKIIMEATEQCGRGRRPNLGDPISFIDACANATQPAILPWEAEDSLGIRAALKSLHPVRSDLTSPVRPFDRLRAGSQPVEACPEQGRRGQGRTPSNIAEISIFIGPEGGFTQGEIETARTTGITPVTLGKRILRSETAAIATVAAVMYEMGELGG